MSARRSEIVEQIIAERERQFNLPGMEYDGRNGPNDWSAIVCMYALRSASTRHEAPSAEDYQGDMIKAAAVILAALEYLPRMQADAKLT